LDLRSACWIAASRGRISTATLSRYIRTGLSIVLNVALVVAILGYFGAETTTFAALIAAGGIAIGVAWAGCSRTSQPVRSWCS